MSLNMPFITVLCNYWLVLYNCWSCKLVLSCFVFLFELDGLCVFVVVLMGLQSFLSCLVRYQLVFPRVPPILFLFGGSFLGIIKSITTLCFKVLVGRASTSFSLNQSPSSFFALFNACLKDRCMEVHLFRSLS